MIFKSLLNLVIVVITKMVKIIEIFFEKVKNDMCFKGNFCCLECEKDLYG